MKKIYKAIEANVAEKKFIGDDDAIPEGWFADAKEALSQYKETKNAMRQEEAPQATEEVTQPRRGRPRKE